MVLHSFLLHLVLSNVWLFIAFSVPDQSSIHTKLLDRLLAVFPLSIHPMSGKFAKHFSSIYLRDYERLFHLTLPKNHDYLILSSVLLLDVDNHGSPQLPSFALNNVAFLTTFLVLALLSIWKTYFEYFNFKDKHVNL